MDKMIMDSTLGFRGKDTTRNIMLDILIALAPATVFGVVMFGAYSFLVVLLSVVCCVGFEYLWRLIFGLENSVTDLSAAVTGLLIALVMPPRIPLWMVVIACFVAVIVIKQAFGGLGKNMLNPAVFAKCLLLIVFPKQMAIYIEPFGDAVLTGGSGSAGIKELVFGTHYGCIGETSALLLLCGAVYLVVRGVINPIIPLSFIGTKALLGFLFGGKGAVSSVFMGGLIIAACFMATDYTTTPKTKRGKLVFGVLCGIISFIISKFFKAEGVYISILIMNLFVPLIDKYIRRKPFNI